MENNRHSEKIFLKLAHLPTLMLSIGYLVYWLELYFIKRGNGQTSPLAWVVFLLIASCFIKKEWPVLLSIWKKLRFDFKQEKLPTKLFIMGGGAVAFALLACAVYAYFLPPHLIQESDALTYHLTIPRQHLILNSFRHIPWSSVDLFSLPVNFALAPYWFVFALPNKIPNLFFLWGLLAVSVGLLDCLNGNKFLIKVLLVFAILGSHNVGIQLGTAMLDLSLCYLFLAFMESFLKGRTLLAAVEFTFFFWSKSFVPIQMMAIALALFLGFIILRTIGFKKMSLGFYDEINPADQRDYQKALKKVLIVFLFLSILIGGPFVVKSTYYAGTPLYPLKAGSFIMNETIDPNSKSWQSIMENARGMMATKDNYGYGRSLTDFIRHFWLVAVPDKGVNNRFDYPLGLPYLLLVGPFIWFFLSCFKAKKFAIVPFFVVLYWGLWWFGAQQSRFLYIPMVLMFLVILPELKMSMNVLKMTLLIALILNGISVVRAHRQDWGRRPQDMLRGKDKELIQLNERYRSTGMRGALVLDFPDVAYAQFPVTVIKKNSLLVLPY